MKKLKTVKETKHEELMSLMNPLIDFMIENNYNYFIIAGKDGIGTRHLRGRFDDITGMMCGMMDNNVEVKGMIEYCANQMNEAQQAT